MIRSTIRSILGATALTLLAATPGGTQPRPGVDTPAAGPGPRQDQPRSGGRGPSVSLTIRIPERRPQTSPPVRDAADDRSPDTVLFLIGDGDPTAIAARARVTLVEVVPLESLRLHMAVAALRRGDSPDRANERLAAQADVLWSQDNHLYQAAAGPSESPPARRPASAPASAALPRGVLAMIDTPFALDHEAFRGASIDQRYFGRANQPAAHGAGVASRMVGRAPVDGAAPQARLVNLAAFQQGADGRVTSETRYVARALDAAIALRPNVLNLSFGGPADRLLGALIDRADARGLCIVAAAGNAGRAGRPPFPAVHPAVLGVTAVDAGGRIYAQATPGPQVDVAAPGVDVMTAATVGFRVASGTSFAAPTVAGRLLRLPACLVERNPARMRQQVSAAARDLGASGRDDVFGAGLFQAP